MMSPQLREISFCSTVRVDCLRIDSSLMIMLVAGHGNTKALLAKTTGAQSATTSRTGHLIDDGFEIERDPVETCESIENRYF